jgi:hypothetical protein
VLPPARRHSCTTRSALHQRWLEPVVDRYGTLPSERPERLRAALLGGTRVGTMGLIDDLSDLGILAQEAEAAWTVLFQGAKELRDEQLLTVAADAREHARRSLRWLRRELEQASRGAPAIGAMTRWPERGRPWRPPA